MSEESIPGIKIQTYEDAMAAWDHVSVIVRREVSRRGEEVVYVYPQIGRGYTYYGFDLRYEACLQVFRSVDQALMWARSRGYDTARIA